jgi:anti-sigma factor RsiW
MNRPSDSELHEFVDGRLSAPRARQIQAWLDEHQDDAVLVDAWRMQKDALRRAYDTYGDTPLPDQLRQRLAQPRWRLPRMAAALAWLASGLVLGFLVRGALSPPSTAVASLPRQAAIAHVVYSPEVRHPVEVGAEHEAHLVQWLSKRLGGKLVIPDLHAAGFGLVGGRLLPADAGPAAQFMYENKDGLRLTLYVRNSPGHQATAFRFAREDGLSVFYWIDGPFGYALSGELGREALLRVADLAYPQLGGR